MRSIEQMLEYLQGIALLLSTQSLVFVSNREEWIFHLAGMVDQERIAQIGALKQFDKIFEGGSTPRSLPFGVAEREVRVDGRSYAVSSALFQWNDPSGAWLLVLLGELAPEELQAQWLGIGLVVSVVLSLLLQVALRAFRNGVARCEAMQALSVPSDNLRLR